MSIVPCYHSRMNAERPKCRRGWVSALATVLALLGLAMPAVRAQPTGTGLYEVEIVVFRASSVGQAEDWAVTPTGRGYGNESTRGGTPQVLRVLAPSDYKLNAIETGLRASGAWRPIAHAAWIQSAANWGTHVGLALADLGINTPALSGMVYLERGTYLHLGVNLTLTEDAPYVINEMRSVKFNEKQYFDHPAFGVIALVSPVAHAPGAATP
jgi:Peptidoglycan-binding protein, CsiV